MKTGSKKFNPKKDKVCENTVHTATKKDGINIINCDLAVSV